jgi:hypothetical protein
MRESNNFPAFVINLMTELGVGVFRSKVVRLVILTTVSEISDVDPADGRSEELNNGTLQ